jgi:hypothetical protein
MDIDASIATLRPKRFLISCSCVLGIASRRVRDVDRRADGQCEETHANSLWGMFGDQSGKTFDTHGVGESENIMTFSIIQA